MDAFTQIRKNYSTFSEVNKRIADYILRNTADFLKQTASEIGKATNTSPASVIRFVKSLDYDGLEKLKLSLASDQGAKQKTKNIDPIVSAHDSLDDLCDKVEAIVNETTNDLFSTVDKKQLATAIEYVQKARKIHLMGIGASSLTAADLYHKFNRAGKDAMYNADVHMTIEFLSFATQKDVFIAVTYSGFTKEVLLACELAKKNNVPVIIITRNNSEKIKQVSDAILLVPDNEHLLRVGAISSLMSSMIIGTVLYLGSIQDRIEDEIEERMVRTKKAISSLKEE